MDIQRLRNLTTKKLHTEIGHVYEDLGSLTGGEGLMTLLPRVAEAVTPWLRENVKDARFWDGEYDPTHVGEFDLPVPTEADKKVFVERVMAMPDPLEGKSVGVVAL